MQYEYAISSGPGTLVAFGVTSDLSNVLRLSPGETIIVTPCTESCETGSYAKSDDTTGEQLELF